MVALTHEFRIWREPTLTRQVKSEGIFPLAKASKYSIVMVTLRIEQFGLRH